MNMGCKSEKVLRYRGWQNMQIFGLIILFFYAMLRTFGYYSNIIQTIFWVEHIKKLNSTKVQNPSNARILESARTNEMITYNGKYTEDCGD